MQACRRCSRLENYITTLENKYLQKLEDFENKVAKLERSIEMKDAQIHCLNTLAASKNLTLTRQSDPLKGVRVVPVRGASAHNRQDLNKSLC